MKYLCLVYTSTEPAGPARADAAAAGRAYRADAEALRGTGRLLAGEALEPESSGISLRPADGAMQTSPIRAGERLDAFFLVAARDLNDAIRVVSRFMPARPARIEVRPVRELVDG